jgi:hypothetical protein
VSDFDPVAFDQFEEAGWGRQRRRKPSACSPPDGRAAYTVWNEPSRSRWIGVVLEAFAATGAPSPPDLSAGPPIFGFADEPEFSRLLTDAGLTDVEVETIEFPLMLESPDELWTGLVDCTVRTRPLLIGQPPELQREIRTNFDRLIEDYRTDTGFEVPVSVKLASGRKS